MRLFTLIIQVFKLNFPLIFPKFLLFGATFQTVLSRESSIRFRLKFLLALKTLLYTHVNIKHSSFINYKDDISEYARTRNRTWISVRKPHFDAGARITSTCKSWSIRSGLPTSELRILF